eukprot:5346900-Pyramimonas_sp.AAC.1
MWALFGRSWRSLGGPRETHSGLQRPKRALSGLPRGPLSAPRGLPVGLGRFPMGSNTAPRGRTSRDPKRPSWGFPAPPFSAPHGPPVQSRKASSGLQEGSKRAPKFATPCTSWK